HPLQQYLTGIFSNVQGFASGDLRIVGKGNNLKYLGKLALTDGELLVDYTQCRYRIPKAEVSLLDDRVDFGSFQIRDDLNNTGTVQTGKLYHSNFKDMNFDFHVVSNRLLLLNTTQADNNQFYGHAIGKADFSFQGPQEDMEMDMAGEPTDSSTIFLPTTNSRVKGGEAPFLSWKVYGKEMAKPKYQKSESNLSVHLKMTANSFAKINVILDEAAGDRISAMGHGTLDLRAGTRENLTLNGRLDIDRGDYTFSFQSIKRRFSLRQNANNFLVWNGDPYNAQLNVSAEYTAPNVRFSDLGLNSNTSYMSAIDPSVRNFVGDVVVIAEIKNTLKTPKINFKIALPGNSVLANNPDAATVLSLITRDENELNKQVSLLVVFNSFGPLSTTRNANFNIAQRGLFEGIVVNSLSSFFSATLTRQFSNLLQTVLKDPTIRVNISANFYNGNNLSDLTTQSTFLNTYRSNFALSINKSYFNERLTFMVGSALDVGFNNAAAASAGNNLQFLPDVNAQLKLTPDGKFVLNFFYRQNTGYGGTNNNVTLGKQSRSGASISFRKGFDSLSELFKKNPK
ncbi:MAG: translocation/assembly module TamB domain-containing protein, partial [Bacteroidetes bacterium]|nr:translocation/assembly module TamB domain-containing protein [Bacteroidota bacterium]